MPLTVDHVSVAVADVQAGIIAFTALGFELATTTPTHARIATETASVVLTTSQEVTINVASDEPMPAFDNRLPLRLVPSLLQDKQPANHPNGALRLERVYITVPDLRQAAPAYASALHMHVPAEQRGNVIKATMCVLDVGHVGVVVAEPVDAGPAAEALARAGAGPFQLLFRVRSLATASQWMTEHGLPEPRRGTRNTGESAILVEPEHACGLYVAFVGPE